MAAEQYSTRSSDQVRRSGHASVTASPSTSFDRRTRSEVDSWVDVSSQPSSSSLSSAAGEFTSAGLRTEDEPRTRRRRTARPARPSGLHVVRNPSLGETSSQEEYEESESEEDRVMTSSAEGPLLQVPLARPQILSSAPSTMTSAPSDSGAALISDEDDENRTAINYPIRRDAGFTPQPNAFSHPPTTSGRRASQPVPGSHFPPSRPLPASRSSTRASLHGPSERNPSHIPPNVPSPAYTATAEHDEALRASLTSLLSVAAAARGLPKVEQKRPVPPVAPPRPHRIDPMTFRLVPESALATSLPPQLQEPTFKPTIRRSSTTSISTTSERQQKHKRKATAGRNASRERRELKKARSYHSSSDDLYVTPTLLTWVVSAGVVVFLSALSFSAGYRLGKEAGRLEMGAFAADEQLRSCAREAGRSSLGLKRSLARSAIQV